MYIVDAIPALVKSLRDFSGPKTEIFICHGRNRQAEPQFLAAIQRHFSAVELAKGELDDVYNCVDVRVLKLQQLL